MKVKICGITNLADARFCVEAGVDALGFVTEYPIPVPWNMKKDNAKELISQMPPSISTTVVTSGEVIKILEIAHFTRPNLVQLHGREGLHEIEAVVKELKSDGIRVIKALSIDIDTGRADFEIPNPLDAALALQGCGISTLVVDSKTRSMPAGTGVALDWKLVRRIRDGVQLPLILAGGLNPDNVQKAIKLVQPYGVDVISGVESSPGIKDHKKIKEFINKVRSSR